MLCIRCNFLPINLLSSLLHSSPAPSFLPSSPSVSRPQAVSERGLGLLVFADWYTTNIGILESLSAVDPTRTLYTWSADCTLSFRPHAASLSVLFPDEDSRTVVVKGWRVHGRETDGRMGRGG